MLCNANKRVTFIQNAFFGQNIAFFSETFSSRKKRKFGLFFTYNEFSTESVGAKPGDSHASRSTVKQGK